MTSTAATSSQSPGETLRGLIWGYTCSQAVRVAAKLGLADLLHEVPRSAADLALEIGAHEPSLHRLLRALTTIGVFTEDPQGRFATAPAGELLRADHPQSARDFAIMMGEPFVWGPWGALDEAIMSGTPTFDHVFGEPFFDYLARHPRDAAIFNAAMTNLSDRDLPAILASYDFSACRRIVDVGGGRGALLRGILERYPDATGVLCDLPTVVADARGLRESAVATRCELVAMDMFQAVPAGGDIYLLKLILHDWSDAEAIRILRNCRRAIADGGKVLVLESVLRPSNEPDMARWADLTMLVLVSGRERTAEEFRQLFAAAGFRLTRIIPAGGSAIIEGIPLADADHPARQDAGRG